MKKRYLLLPIKPEHLVNILNGKKTIEIRKYMPKCDLPIEVLCYCTKPKRFWHVGCMGFYNDELWYHPVKNIYICDDSCELMCLPEGYTYTKDNFLKGKIVAKFTLSNISSYEVDMTCYEQNSIYLNNKYIGELQTSKLEFLNLACLSNKDLEKYLTKENGDIINKFYAWHIDDLVIFDKPKKLRDYGVEQAPQKYCYVYENEE